MTRRVPFLALTLVMHTPSISPVLRTWVPPQGQERPATVTMRVAAPYFVAADAVDDAGTFPLPPLPPRSATTATSSLPPPAAPLAGPPCADDDDDDGASSPCSYHYCARETDKRSETKCRIIQERTTVLRQSSSHSVLAHDSQRASSNASRHNQPPCVERSRSSKRTTFVCRGRGTQK